MIPLEHLKKRRQQFLSGIERPVLLFAGGARARNYPDNHYPDRADSNFLFFFGSGEADSVAFFDPSARSVTLFAPERTVERSLWEGSRSSFDELREEHAVERVLAVENLEAHLQKIAGGRKIDSLAVADSRTTRRARAITGDDLDFYNPRKIGPSDLVDHLASLRLRKEAAEVAEIESAVEVTKSAVEIAMRRTKAGITEQELAGEIAGCFAQAGCCPAYPTILSVRGEVLHNYERANTLADADLVLCDLGAEVASGYGCDVTRTWPVSGDFTAEAKDVYEIVLHAQKTAIENVAPGVRFRDIHVKTALELTQGLVDLGVLNGSPETLVDSGAHALFFPHGLGHFLGLDTHDLESFGDRVLYSAGRSRSRQFGTSFLRIDHDLEPGMIITIEPGIYFVPAILRHKEFRERFAGSVNFERAERYLNMNNGRGFGGIRIEDDVLTTDTGAHVLTAAIRKEIEDIEASLKDATASAHAG